MRIDYELSKKYYKISEVAQLLGLPDSTLRYWESRFTVIKPRRNDRGTRFYSPDDIDKIRMVMYLVKEKGMHIDAAQEQIRINRDLVSKKVEALDRLRDVRNRLQDLLKTINRRQSAAEAKIASAATTTEP